MSDSKRYIIRGRSTEGQAAVRDTIDLLKRQIKRDPEKRGFLLLSYITAICSGIECEANDEIIQHFAAQTGTRYRAYVRPLQFLGIQDKARFTVLLSSDYRYALNEASSTVKALFELFAFRNKLVHIAHHVQEHQITFDEHGEIASSSLVAPPGSDYWSLRDDDGEPLTKEYVDGCYEVYRECIGLFGSLAWRIQAAEFEPTDMVIELHADGRQPALRPVFMYKMPRVDS